MIGKFKTVHLIGSTKGNAELFSSAEKYFTKKGYIVFKPVFFDLKSDDPRLEMYNDMCYDKLLFCDIVCITTPSHIGKSTLNRINQSIQLGKDIIIYENDNIKEYITTKEFEERK